MDTVWGDPDAQLIVDEESDAVEPTHFHKH